MSFWVRKKKKAATIFEMAAAACKFKLNNISLTRIFEV